MLFIALVSAYWIISSLVLMGTAITSKSSTWIRLGYVLLSIWGAAFFGSEVALLILLQGVH